MNSEDITINDLLAPESVVFIEETTKEAALTKMVDVLAQVDQVTDRDILLEKIFHREELMSTGIGMGIAVPHTRIPSVSDLVMAFGVCKNPLEDYQSLDHKPVSIIVMIAANESQHAKHLRTLSLITKVLKDEETFQGILNAKSTNEIYQLLTGA